MLRHYLGDEVFFNALHNYLVSNAYKCVQLPDLQKAMEEASGKDLSWFFDEWFTKPGHPILEIRQQYDSANQKLYVYVDQTQLDEKTPVYKIPTEIDIYQQNGPIKKEQIWLNHEKDTFTFHLAAPPLLVNFDAEKIILCHKTDIRPVRQWYYQYYNSTLLIDRYEALKALSRSYVTLSIDSSVKLWSTALHDVSWYIRKNAINFLKTQNKEIIDAVLPAIEQLAKSDKKSAVRSNALMFIQETEGAKSNQISLNALKDSSYYVVSVAIRNIFKNTPPNDSADLVKTITEFDKYRSVEVLTSVADIYAKYADAGKMMFFKNMSARLKGGYMNAYLLDYLQFLNRMDTRVIQQDLKFILSLDHLIKSDWERGSYQYFLNSLAKNLSDRNDPVSNQLSDVFKEKAKDVQKGK